MIGSAEKQIPIYFFNFDPSLKLGYTLVSHYHIFVIQGQTLNTSHQGTTAYSYF